MTRSTLKTLAADRSGAVMVMGVWMAVFLVGLMHYVLGLGEVVFLQESLQDAADSGAYAAAVVYAQSLNFIVSTNITLVTIVAIAMALDIVASSAMACAGSSPGGVCCSVVIALGLSTAPHPPDDPGKCGVDGGYRYYQLQAEFNDAIDATNAVRSYIDSGAVREAAERRGRQAARRNDREVNAELAAPEWPIAGRSTGPSLSLCRFLIDARLADGAVAEVGVPPDTYSYPHTYDSCIAAAARANDIPESLIKSVIRQESGFDPGALSPVGAIGLMQLMPETARSLGVNPHDPCDNIRGGARLLRELRDTMGNWPDAIAGYNGGPGFPRGPYGAPAIDETKLYVPSVLGFWMGQRDPADVCIAHAERARPFELDPGARMGSEWFQLRFVVTLRGGRPPDDTRRGVAIPKRLSPRATRMAPAGMTADRYDEPFAFAQAEYFTDEPTTSGAMFRMRWEPRLRMFRPRGRDARDNFTRAARRAGEPERETHRSIGGLILH